MNTFQRKDVDTQKLYKLIDAAESGDKDALAALQRENALMAKAANMRMRRLEEAGFVSRETGEIRGTYAYERAKYFLQDMGKRYFSESKKQTLEQIKDQIDEEIKFMNSLSSTPGGERIRIKKNEARIKELADVLYKPDDLDTNIVYEADEKEVRSLKNFFRSDAWAVLRERGITSSDAVREAATALNRGASMLTLRALVKDYEKGELSKFQVWEGWTSGLKAKEVREKAGK